MCGAECWSDHRLLISKMNLRKTPPRGPQGIIVSKRLNVSKLKSDLVKHELASELESKLQCHNTNPHADMEIEWARVRDAVYATASKRLAQSELRHMQDEWLRMRADAIQAYADGKDTKNFYSALKAVYDPTSSGLSPILSADGCTII